MPLRCISVMAVAMKREQSEENAINRDATALHLSHGCRHEKIQKRYQNINALVPFSVFCLLLVAL